MAAEASAVGRAGCCGGVGVGKGEPRQGAWPSPQFRAMVVLPCLEIAREFPQFWGPLTSAAPVAADFPVR